jgi:hypothetical protein
MMPPPSAPYTTLVRILGTSLVALFGLFSTHCAGDEDGESDAKGEKGQQGSDDDPAAATEPEDRSELEPVVNPEAAANPEAATEPVEGLVQAAACLPMDSRSECDDDAEHPYPYACNAMQVAQPERSCVKATTTLPLTLYCCANPLCVRQLGTEYLCTDSAKPDSYLCSEAATHPEACDDVGSVSVQMCCP